jgi:FkbM family methyltransferase
VIGFEADPDNFRCARRNLAPFGDRARIRHAAAWRSDERVALLHLRDCPEPTNTGWREVFGDDSGTAVEAVPFDEIIRDATDYGRRRVSILKIDCEGSEFPILLTSRTLHLVDSILGEYHEFNSPNLPEPIPAPARVAGYDRYTMAELTPVLERWGFSVTVKPYPNTRLGLFFAHRQPARVAAPHFLHRVRSLVAGPAAASRPGR